MNDRATSINIGGKEYELLLTTRATKEIALKFGGLEKLGTELGSGNFEKNIDTLVWLVVTLANQSIMLNNYLHGTKEPLLTPEYVELATTPSDLGTYNEALTEALMRGAKREIESEPKNA